MNLRGRGAFERRIRNRIVGPAHRFTVIAPAELSPLCLREIAGLGIENAETSEAGVEFTGKLTAAYTSNLWSRTASRVLCRLEPFRAGVPEELLHRVAGIPWELWLNPSIPLNIESHVEYSRVSHEGLVSELVYRGIEKSVRLSLGQRMTDEKSVTGSGLQQRVLVHLTRNQCRISLDTSGAHLHERGYRLTHAGAPLRETLAAAIILKMGWNGLSPLIDGMCGSGTFPIESALIARRLPPGLHRQYLFQKWPSFQDKTWDYLCQSARAGVVSGSIRPIIGIDKDRESIRISEQNAVRAGVGGDIDWKCMDFFDFDPAAEKLEKGALLLNPPFGKRLEGGGRHFYARIGDHLRHRYRGWHYAVLSLTRNEASALGMGRMRLWAFRHGGVTIYAALGTVPL